MIQKRARPRNVEKLLERLDAADAALCNAALTNTLTKRGDEWLRRIIHEIRRFTNDATRAAPARGREE